MTAATGAPSQDAALSSRLLERVTQDLGVLIGREMVMEELRSERAAARPAGRQHIHISFKLAASRQGKPKRHGALLVPLPEAITLACLLLMIPEDGIARRREESELDPALKDAMLEIGNLIGGSCNAALSEHAGMTGWSLRSEGCQGVRPDVRPAFPYVEGSELLVGRVTTSLAPFPSFELILMLPPLA